MEAALSWLENSIVKPTLSWSERTFARNEDDAEGVLKTTIYSLMSLSFIVVSVLSGTVLSLLHDHTLAANVALDAAHAIAFAISVFALVGMRVFGLKTWLKVTLMFLWFCWIIAMDMFVDYLPVHFYVTLLLDACLILESDRDSTIMQGVAMLICLITVVYLTLRAIDSGGVPLHLHPLKSHIDYICDTQADPTRILVDIVVRAFPIVANYSFVRMYFVTARTEAHNLKASGEAATLIAEKLVNFDLDAADKLLSQADEQLPIHEPLSGLLKNLRSYRSFLPYALFASTEDESLEPPNAILAEATHGKSMSLQHADAAVARLRDPEYSLADFHQDVSAAFPELKLYDLKQGSCSSGHTGFEEYQRTMGAMYSVYCLARLDIDGKNIFSYGVDENWRARTKPHGPDAAKRQTFYESVDWESLQELFVRANVLTAQNGGVASSAIAMVASSQPKSLRLLKAPSAKKKDGAKPDIGLNTDRMMALLVLTAVHDVMKNPDLLPTVQERHAPYRGVQSGSRILDHDLALAYVMEYFPRLLPSYHALGAGQRAPVLFSQGKMGFNNGWLVQGEAPPGALFSTFKRVIAEGCAGEGDVSFYFAHWLTDLAGAIPHGSEPWPGSEKFAAKFPLRVLNAFLESFSFVDKLASKHEVEVMEEYLASRWHALGLRQRPPDGHAPAARRLALMAQGFESGAVDALLAIPAHDRETIAAEMARTGCRQQFADSPPTALEPSGPALLVYYAPALVQKAGEAQVDLALQLLAAVYRSARQLVGTETGPAAAERTVVVRIESMKVLTPTEIMASAPWHLRRLSDTDMEAVRGDIPDSGCSNVAEIAIPRNEERDRSPARIVI